MQYVAGGGGLGEGGGGGVPCCTGMRWKGDLFGMQQRSTTWVVLVVFLRVHPNAWGPVWAPMALMLLPQGTRPCWVSTQERVTVRE